MTVLSPTNSVGTTTFSYDIMGRLDRVVDANNNVISYTYDRFGNRTQITGPNGTLKYTYDQLGRIETVTDQQGSVTRYTYDELGRQKKTSYANGAETLYTYDSLSRLTSVTNRKTSGEIITSHKYTLDAAGHRTKIEEAGSTVEYGYDKLNRLTSEKRNGVVTLDDGYTYDPVGNRLTKASLGGNSSYTYDENDRLKSDGKYTYGWDENGNLTSRTGSDGSATYKYDPENRLIGGPSGTVQFAYDAQNNRISRTTSAGTTTFVVDPNMPYAQVLEETTGEVTKEYAYGNNLLNVQGPEGMRWFAYDGLGSTRALTDGAGTLTDTYTYEAFGTVVHRTGTSANDFQFTGEQYESALDMYYLRARYYEPGTGRFGARDAWEGDQHRPLSRQSYLYCEANPSNCADPSGNMTMGELASNMAVSGVLSSLSGMTVRSIARMFTGETTTFVGELKWAAQDFLMGMLFAQIALLGKALVALHYARVAAQAEIAVGATLLSTAEEAGSSVVGGTESALTAGLTPPRAGTFVSSEVIRTTSTRTLVRGFGGNAGQMGSYWGDLILPREVLRNGQAILPEWNSLTGCVIAEIEEGTAMWVGDAARQGIYDGGMTQYYIPKELFGKIHIRAIIDLPTSFH